MKSKVLLLILSVLLLACGARNKELQKSEDTADLSSSQKSSEQITSSNRSESVANMNRYLENIGLKIMSAGKDYQFQIGNLKFSGNADVEFSNKKEETKIDTQYKEQTQYKSLTTYWSHVTYKTRTLYKTVEVKSNKPMFWLYALLYFLGVTTIPVLKILIKKNGKF